MNVSLQIFCIPYYFNALMCAINVWYKLASNFSVVSALVLQVEQVASDVTLL